MLASRCARQRPGGRCARGQRMSGNPPRRAALSAACGRVCCTAGLCLRRVKNIGWRHPGLEGDTVGVASWLLSVDERRALVVLANAPDGATTALLLGYGFTRETIIALVRAGLVTATPDEVARPDGRVIDVSRVELTEVG